MQTFLEEVVDDVLKKYDIHDNLIFVLPSKRAGNFLKRILANTVNKTVFSPVIYSIEAFIEHISALNYASKTQLLFELYHSYLKTAAGEKDSFYEFSKWGQVLIQDFNEIDRYLVDPHKIFSYLSAIQEVEHWYVRADKTKLMEDYIQFWNQLEPLYHLYRKNLSEKKLGYQGMVYRQAVDALPTYLHSVPQKKHIFIGFNALNKAEDTLLQQILGTEEGAIYWDTDPYFLNDPLHDAGYFIRQHLKNWKHLNEKSINRLKDHYLTEKNIQIVAVPRNVSQAKYVGNLLSDIHRDTAAIPENTALVLGDEVLLNPIINAIPETMTAVNITMGYPLEKTPLASLFTQFFELYLRKEPQGWYYKNILSFLSNPYIQLLSSQSDNNLVSNIQEEIKTRNKMYLDLNDLQSMASIQNTEIFSFFFNEQPSPEKFIDMNLQLIKLLKAYFNTRQNSLVLEYLYHFYTLFNQLNAHVTNYAFISDLKGLNSLYKNLISEETVDFQGEPMEGLQIMGMLESRNLDFETVIITSVNEGVLPAGKTNNSFIPYDLKREFSLPTFKEKDAVYTYHFYRLLQRAKNIYLLYNSEPDALEGGEKSRLISQILTDELPQATVNHIVATAEIMPNTKIIQTIDKSPALMTQLKVIAAKGLSPTALANYIRNPIDFYKKTVLKIDDALEVEETITASTFGTIIHDSLETLYRPLIGTLLSEKSLSTLKPQINKVVERQFNRSYPDGDISYGKNHIAYHVICRHIDNFISSEIIAAKTHKIKLLAVEKDLILDLNIPEIEFPVRLKGKLDRVDEFDGTLRIIDYKTGTVSVSQVEVVSWEEVILDDTYSKAFQLMCYALMYREQASAKYLVAGIISFKNLSSGIFRFATKETRRSRSKDHTIDDDKLSLFRTQLYRLLCEILNPELAFTAKAL